jgi:hypothetical protein
MRWACEPGLAYPANLVSRFKDANLDQLGDGQVFESLGLHAFDEVRSDFEDAPAPAFSELASWMGSIFLEVVRGSEDRAKGFQQ